MQALVTGAGGLVGSEVSHLLLREGWEVVGIENDSRSAFFGPKASTWDRFHELASEFDGFRPVQADVRDRAAMLGVGASFGAYDLIVHAAAQPSHDWAAMNPQVDFDVNAKGTLNLLEAVRHHSPASTFVLLSTNKVYGDHPNWLPLEERSSRYELPASHIWHRGVDTTMAIDQATHSLFGVSKTAADLLTQEYGRYFGMNTVCFRCGCITGAHHAGAEQHGFLAYLVEAAVAGRPYTVYGYGGKQVRDNISGMDVARACLAFHENPRPGAVFNLGGGRDNSCSVLEAIEVIEQVWGHRLDWSPGEARRADHMWWISDNRPFAANYDWQVRDSLGDLLAALIEAKAA